MLGGLGTLGREDSSRGSDVASVGQQLLLLLLAVVVGALTPESVARVVLRVDVVRVDL